MKANFTPTKGVVYPFDTPEFYEAWTLWLQYRKENRWTIKGIISEQAQLKKLSRLANGDPLAAVDVINQSIENNWRGLFALKTSSNEQRNNTARQLAEALQRRRFA